MSHDKQVVKERIKCNTLAINAYHADAKNDKRKLTNRERDCVEALEDYSERLERWLEIIQ